MSFEGRRYAISGGAGGIGLAAATYLVAKGARVVLMDRRRPDPAKFIERFLLLDVEEQAQSVAVLKSLADMMDASDGEDKMI